MYICFNILASCLQTVVLHHFIIPLLAFKSVDLASEALLNFYSIELKPSLFVPTFIYSLI